MLNAQYFSCIQNISFIISKNTISPVSQCASIYLFWTESFVELSLNFTNFIIGALVMCLDHWPQKRACGERSVFCTHWVKVSEYHKSMKAPIQFKQECKREQAMVENSGFKMCKSSARMYVRETKSKTYVWWNPRNDHRVQI